jgi:hypothetical protein
LGSENYGVHGYWDKSSKDGERYSYYRKSTRGHNTITFGGYDGHVGPSNQLVGSTTVISKFNGAGVTKGVSRRVGTAGVGRSVGADGIGRVGGNRSAVVDMTAAYEQYGATQVERHFAWDSSMSTLTITDALAVNNAMGGALNVTWAMHGNRGLATI